TGFLVPAASGTYRMGLSGPNAELMLDGHVLARHKNQPWGTRSDMVTLTLEKGHRDAMRVTTEALLLGGVEVLWKRVSTQAERDLAAAAVQADVVVAAVGLNSDLEGEEMKVELDGVSGGGHTPVDLRAAPRN